MHTAWPARAQALSTLNESGGRRHYNAIKRMRRRRLGRTEKSRQRNQPRGTREALVPRFVKAKRPWNAT